MRLQTRRLLRFSSRLLACVSVVVGLSQPATAQSQVSWSFVGPNAVRDRVIALASDPRNDSIVYLAAPGGGVWQTQDGGQSWIPLIDTTLSLQVCSLATDPNTPDLVYLGTGDDQSPRPAQGVLRSADDGRTWTLLPRFTNQPVCALVVDPANSSRVFAGSLEGLFESTDSGATWAKIMTGAVTSVAIDGSDIYAGTLGPNTQGQRDKNLAHSSDGGTTWTMLTLPPNSNTPNAPTTWVSVSANSNSVNAVVAYEDTLTPGAPSRLDFYRTGDAGSTWASSFSIGQAHTPVQTLISPSDGSIYVTGLNLYASRDQGSNWLTIRTGGGDLHAATFSSGMLIMGGEQGVDSLSLVQGTFAQPLTQLPIGRFLRTTFDALGGTWAAGPAGLFPLANISGPPLSVPYSGIGPTGNVVAPASTSLNILASGNSAVYRSTDAGGHFSSRPVVPDSELRAGYPPLVLDPVTPTSAYLGAQHLYRTTDGGLTWTTLPSVDPDPLRVVVALTMAPSSRLTLYAATACLNEIVAAACPQSSNVWRSTNGGQTWTALSPVQGFVSRLAVDPRQPTTVYAAVGGFPGGPSTSAGSVSGDLLCLGLCSGQTISSTTWSSVHGNLPKIPINAVIIDPTSVPTSFTQPTPKLYVATDTGVFVTFNAGAQWTDITNGPDLTHSLPATPITDVFLRSSDGTLLASTFGRGVYATATSGLFAGVTANPLSTSLTLMRGSSTNTGVGLSNPSTTTSAGWLLIPVDPWITVTSPSGVLGPGGTTQAAVRISAANLQAGTYRGRLQLISGPYTQNIFIDAHVTTAPSNIAIVAGDNTAGGTGATIPLQVIVSDSRQLPLSGISVTFAITSGGGSLSTRNAVTSASGIASTVLTLPPIPSTVKVVASTGSVSVTFTDNAVSAPALTSDSVIDGITLNPYTSLGPGSVIAISGRNLATGSAAAPSTTLPAVLQSTQAIVSSAGGDVPLQLFSVSPTLIQALVPVTIPAGTYQFRVEVGGVRSNSIQISVAAFAPGIFTVNNAGKGRGVFLKQDGSLITTANPADRGSTISFYASGLGPLNAQNRTSRTPQVYFDSYAATVVSSTLATTQPGRYLVAVRVPTQLSPGNSVSVSLTIGGFSSNRVTIPVR